MKRRATAAPSSSKPSLSIREAGNIVSTSSPNMKEPGQAAMARPGIESLNQPSLPRTDFQGDGYCVTN
jgi:hypothetical protein